jgi:hypothetical protein
MDNMGIWNMFALEQELSVHHPVDQHGRHLYQHSLKIQEPVVSQDLFNNGFRPAYPQGQSFAVCVSHDIDHLFYPAFSTKNRYRALVKALVSGQLSKAWRYFDKNDPINPYWNVEDILQFEKRLGAQSTFFFLSLDKHDQDFNYEVADIKSLFLFIREHGFEVGLHGGHLAYNNSERMKYEKSKLQHAAGEEVTAIII